MGRSADARLIGVVPGEPHTASDAALRERLAGSMRGGEMYLAHPDGFVAAADATAGPLIAALAWAGRAD